MDMLKNLRGKRETTVSCVRKSSPFPSLLLASPPGRRPGLFTLSFSSTELRGSGRRSPLPAAHHVKSDTLATDKRKCGAVAFKTKAQRFRRLAQFYILLLNNK